MTSDGLSLRAEQRVPDGPRAAAVIAHPHPLYGGDMGNPVVVALFDALAGVGVATLRFDFRGAGGSEGTFGEGVGERADTVAAIEQLGRAAPDVPMALVGYSFGADVALGVTDERLAGWFLVAPPLQAPTEVDRDERPKRLVVPAHDQFRPPDSAQAAVAGWTNTAVEVIEGADHFLAGHLGQAAKRCTAFFDDLLG